ncbi:MAG: type 1 glutamine amidotransferase domain-containing protein [Bryobacteraceae bacterium]|jgi:protease I
MQNQLQGKRVAILVANGFEQVEMTEPRKALEAAGAKADLVSPEKKEVQGMNHDEKAEKFKVEVALDSASPSDYDALLLPGGVANPDKLRTIPAAVRFVAAFFAGGKPVAAICHGPWMLVEAGVLQRRTVTSWPSLRTDIRNAGGEWVDREVVSDDGLVTSRKPDDIPAFNRKMVEAFSEAAHKKSQSEQRRQPEAVRHA